MGLWTNSRLSFNSFYANAQASIRHVAHPTGWSKSRVQRRRPGSARRDRHPESWLWETAEGRGWFIRLVVAALYTFGRKRGVGAETLSAFCTRRRRERPVGCSPSALRGLRHALAHGILETAAAGDQEGSKDGEGRPIMGAVEAPFLQHMRRVMMALVSGSLWVEDVAEARPSATGDARGEARRAALGGAGWSLVRARATARMKLAEPGLACLSIPEVLPLIHALGKSDALALGSRLRQAPQALRHAPEPLSKGQASDPSDTAPPPAPAVVETRAAAVARWASVRGAYRPPPRDGVVDRASVAGGGLAAPALRSSGTPGASRERGERSAERTDGGAGQKEGPGPGAPTARGLVRAGRLWVARRVAGCAARRPAPVVDARG